MKKKMNQYRITGPQFLMRFGCVGLSRERANKSASCLKPVKGTKNIYEVTDTVVFGRGEVIGLEEEFAAPNVGGILEPQNTLSKKGGSKYESRSDSESA